MTAHPRTPRLRWQSRVLVLAIPAFCAAIVAASATRMWASTRTGLSIGLAIGFTAWLLRAATPPAAVTGGILAAAMLLEDGLPGSPRWLHTPFAPLMALLLLTLAATRFRKQEKERLGAAQDGSGRSAAQVAANLGIAALAGAIPQAISLLPSLNGAISPFFLRRSAVVLVAALAEATADTLSSELGVVLGGKPFLITTLRRVPAGTDGAVSAAGVLAGVLGAVVIVLAAVLTMGLDRRSALAAGLGALGGLLFDSLLGATLERRGWLNNDAVNFLSTLAAAVLSVGLLCCFQG